MNLVIKNNIVAFNPFLNDDKIFDLFGGYSHDEMQRSTKSTRKFSRII
jgi:hypothetical protein